MSTGKVSVMLGDGTSANVGRNWFGIPTTLCVGTLEEMKAKLPTFGRMKFQASGEAGIGKNEFADMVYRKEAVGRPAVPVGMVGKRYKLIQHSEVVDALGKTLKRLKLAPGQPNTSLLLTQYGERMLLKVFLPKFTFHPGDGEPLVLFVECQNSVDRSLALTVRLGWYRLVCWNGLMFSVRETNVRQVHTLEQANAGTLLESIEPDLRLVKEEQEAYRGWVAKPVNADRLTDWADGPLCAAWGSFMAARALSIANRGVDGEVVKAKSGTRPSRLRVEPLETVPGASVPAKNLWDVSQALSWLATKQGTIQGELEKVMQIAGLVEALKN